MVTHEQRLAAARDAIGYICSRSDGEMATPVPNCPGWTVYNAAVHIGRVGIAWRSMIEASPDDPASRTRGYADAESRGGGHAPSVLASWALGAVDALEAPLDRPAYFSMTGGHGTVALWGWHAASELGVHRLDVEHALGHDHLLGDALSDDLALDAISYTAAYFLPAMSRATGQNPGQLTVTARRGAEIIGTAEVGVEADANGPAATIEGAPIDVLLALWGRPHGPLEVEGSPEVFYDGWQVLPSVAFQFGTWD